MKLADIKIGKTYHNRGRGTTIRRIMGIGDEHRPQCWFSLRPRPNEPGVLYEQGGRQACLYLSSFAAWAGGVAE